MEKYNGLQFGDKIEGGGSYVAIEGRGGEICNFTEVDSYYFGYVQIPGNTINIERLGALPNEDYISGITVIWTATRPKLVGGGTTIVGWYKNATIFKEYQHHKKIPTQLKNNGIDGYFIKANIYDSHLITEPDARNFEIPRQVKGGMGQSNLWYADSDESVETVKSVLEYISNNGKKTKKTHKKSKVPDQLRKVAVEKAAITACLNHYEELGYTVVSVEKYNVGWDLEAIQGKVKLRIEVKGLSGNDFKIELTSNEFTAFSLTEDNYRLAVVTCALTNPTLHICRYSRESSRWIIENNIDKIIEINIRQSATVSCA